MKVVTTKSDIQSKPLDKSNNQSSDSAQMGDDFFSDIISSLFVELPEQKIDDSELTNVADNEGENTDNQAQLDQSLDAILYNPNEINIQQAATQVSLVNLKLNVNDNSDVDGQGGITNSVIDARSPVNGQMLGKSNQNYSAENTKKYIGYGVSENLYKNTNTDNESVPVDMIEAPDKKPANPDDSAFNNIKPDLKSILLEMAAINNKKTHLISKDSNSMDEVANNDQIGLVPQNYKEAFNQLANMINANTMAANEAKPSHATRFQITTDHIFTPSSPNNLTQALPELSITTHRDAAINAAQVFNANIKIYPPELGAVLARLKIGKSGAELSITAENQKVKQIIETNLPLLRENFQRADINLTDITVNVQPFQADTQSASDQGADNQFGGSQFNNESAASNQEVDNTKNTKRIIQSIIDTYI